MSDEFFVYLCGFRCARKAKHKVAEMRAPEKERCCPVCRGRILAGQAAILVRVATPQPIPSAGRRVKSAAPSVFA